MGEATEDQASAARWMRAMLAGDFEAAWRESDATRVRGLADPHRFWQGEELTGKRVIVRCLHGFGDTVQMLRYAPALNVIAQSVVWEVPPRMVELAPFFTGLERVATWGEEAPPWDVQIEVMELPYLMRTGLRQLPIATGYLKLPEVVVAKATLAIGKRSRPRVGLVWAGGDWNASRSVPFQLFQPLLNVLDLEFWNLQGGVSAREAEGTAMRDATSICGNGQLALAATIANLDLVISVDTLAAHAAGAIGKPVWVLLQAAADWRWMLDRSDSPWYPTMRLFRQRVQGDWGELVDRVAAALASHRW